MTAHFPFGEFDIPDRATGVSRLVRGTRYVLWFFTTNSSAGDLDGFSEFVPTIRSARLCSETTRPFDREVWSSMLVTGRRARKAIERRFVVVSKARTSVGCRVSWIRWWVFTFKEKICSFCPGSFSPRNTIVLLSCSHRRFEIAGLFDAELSVSNASGCCERKASAV